MPVAPQDDSFYITGGTLPADAGSYVERQADKNLNHSTRSKMRMTMSWARAVDI